MSNTAPAVIHALVETFALNLDAYHGSKNETELRREFLDKFLAALGWDVANEKGNDEFGKEVLHEFSVDVAGQQKKADYAFRAGRGNKFDFLVEAKKPSVKVETSQEAAFQIRRYGWSAKLPINILTDFEHFAVYDCRTKPNISDKAALGRILLIHYKEYVERWSEIAALFAPAAVRQGSLAKYAEGAARKKGTADVDTAFLQEIERWRELLARNIALRNAAIDIAGLNYSVQMTIDRIVFLRICEERGIEPENQLLEIGNRDGMYAGLCQLFKRADTKYNSGLFHFKPEKEVVSRPDDLTLSLAIDDKVLKDIISNLYYPKSPYAFLYIPSDILGQVYERFLGKVIRLTTGHQAKVEEKPAVRKAGGVYYTPTYIVDYIVKNTVGKLVENKNPQAVAALKVVDPACGSGSFLLGAYQFLLDWHLHWYSAAENEPEVAEKNKAIVRVGDGYRLTTTKKKEILVNNIFGVDIDAQAVEVTKLSLLLKVLENASGQLELGMERVLPDLGNNIKCGNSLIGFDYFAGQLLPDEEERARVNPFDWKNEFKDVFARGGFDAVIGNPPYIRIQAMQEWASNQVEFLKQKYTAASKGNYDIYVVFIEKTLPLLNAKGEMGFILPHKFFNAHYGEPVRGIISQGRHISKIVHFGDLQVFHGATTYTCLLFLNNKQQAEFEFTRVSNVDNWRVYQTSEISEISEVSGMINAANVNAAEWNFTVGKGAALFEKLSQMPVKLKDIAARVFQGLVTGADPVFVVKNRGGEKYYSEATNEEHKIEKGVMHLLCKGSVNIRRYFVSQLEKSILFPYIIVDGKATLLSPKELETHYPSAWQYLKENRGLLESRERGKWKHEKWYAFGRSQNLSEMEQEKILTPSISNRASFTFDSTDYYYFIGSGGGGGGGYGITINSDSKLNYKYLLGLLNSKLLDTYLKTYSSSFRGGYYAYNRQYIDVLPIRPIDFANPAEAAHHNKMVSYVESMLAAHKSLATAQSPQEKERLERQIDVTDKAIDALVYELYGLKEDEIKIVEGEK